MCFRSQSAKEILIALWTVIQTSFHILFLLGEYYICQFKPSHYMAVIVYLTYFYNYDKCGSITLAEENSFFTLKPKGNFSRLIDLETDLTDEEDNIYKIVETILEKAILPRESNYYFRTQLYLLCYVILDGCLFFSAFLLFVGVCLQVKKCWSIIFYLPWLVITSLSVILDVIASVHFGLDNIYITNYTSWLKFIGIDNYKDFTKLNNYQTSVYVPHISSCVMALFLSKFLVFWIINIVHVSTITNTFLAAYKGGTKKLINGQKLGIRVNTRKSNINSSESRIRNWQMFYGTVDTNSPTSSTSDKSTDYDSNNSRIVNSTRKNSEEYTKKVAGNSTTRYSLDSSNGEFLSSTVTSPKLTSNYLKFQDFTEGVDTNEIHRYRRDSKVSEINQRPWSYLQFIESPRCILPEEGENSRTRIRHISTGDNKVGSTIL